MNETTWQKILQWEALHPTPTRDPNNNNQIILGTEPKLLRFLGRPSDYSPKALFKIYCLGHIPPFDRHDWIVDRYGKEIRYIIDYYHDEAVMAAATAATSSSDAPGNQQKVMQSIKIDVRPALDSFMSFYDRFLYMPYQRFRRLSAFEPLPLLPPTATKIAEQQKLYALESTLTTIRETCQQEKEQLVQCHTNNNSNCENLSIALQRCTAGIICPSLAQDFDQAIKAHYTVPAGDDKGEQGVTMPINTQKNLEISYEKMIKCLELFELDAKKTFADAKRK
jgi:hypothetical protein